MIPFDVPGISTTPLQLMGSSDKNMVFLDGAIGSHTACVGSPYVDKATSGVCYADPEEVAAHVAACTAAGLCVNAGDAGSAWANTCNPPACGGQSGGQATTLTTRLNKLIG